MPQSRELGDLLRTARERHALTEAELGGRLGVHRTTISRWENGTTLPAPPLIRRLARHLKIKTAALGDARHRDLAARNGERLIIAAGIVAVGAHALITWRLLEPIARGLGLS